MKASEQPDPDMFQYAIYVQLSSIVHGSANSLTKMVKPTPHGLATESQPAEDPLQHQFGAALTLAWMVDAFATDPVLRQSVWRDLGRLRRDAVALAAVRRARRQRARAAR